MRLTVLLSVFNAQQYLPRVGASLVGIGDELVIGIDDATDDATLAIAQRFTDRIHYVPHAAFLVSGQPGCKNWIEQSVGHCRGDWILRVEHDETLSAHWHDRMYVNRILLDRYATHCWIPRRWAIPPGDRYIADKHWYPDPQMRLFRNLPSLVRSYCSVHEPMSMVGEARFLSEAWIVHWDLVWRDRKAREKKVDYYGRVGNYTGAEYYLYEEQSFSTRPLNWRQPRPQHRSSRLSGNNFTVSIEPLDLPASIEATQTAAVFVAIQNLSNRELWPSNGCTYPANVRISYHWYRPADEIPYIWEGCRYDLPTRVSPENLHAHLYA